VKRKLSPVTTAVILILVLGAVLYAYTRGLLGGKQPGGAKMGGGGAMPSPPPPPMGLPTVRVSTFAGYVRPGFADGKGWEAKFNGPAGIAAAPDGSLYVSDSRNHRLRRVAPDGTVTTVAGSGPTDCLPGGFADGPADQARLFNPAGLAVAGDGTVYFADSGNHRIRKLKDGVVTTVAGCATPQDDVGCEQGGYRDGPATTAQFRFPAAVALEASGAILVADLGNGRLRRISGATVSTVPNTPALREPTALAPGPGAALQVADPGAGTLSEMGAAGLAIHPRSGLVPKSPTGLCPLGAGDSVVVDAEWHAIYALNGATCVLLAGVLPPAPECGFRDGTGDVARFSGPCAAASIGNTLYVTDFGNNCIRAVVVPPDWATPLPPPHPRGRGFRHRREGDRSAD